MWTILLSRLLRLMFEKTYTGLGVRYRDDVGWRATTKENLPAKRKRSNVDPRLSSDEVTFSSFLSFGAYAASCSDRRAASRRPKGWSLEFSNSILRDFSSHTSSRLCPASDRSRVSCWSLFFQTWTRTCCRCRLEIRVRSETRSRKNSQRSVREKKRKKKGKESGKLLAT